MCVAVYISIFSCYWWINLAQVAGISSVTEHIQHGHSSPPSPLIGELGLWLSGYTMYDHAFDVKQLRKRRIETGGLREEEGGT